MGKKSGQRCMGGGTPDPGPPPHGPGWLQVQLEGREGPQEEETRTSVQGGPPSCPGKGAEVGLTASMPIPIACSSPLPSSVPLRMTQEGASLALTALPGPTFVKPTKGVSACVPGTGTLGGRGLGAGRPGYAGPRDSGTF